MKRREDGGEVWGKYGNDFASGVIITRSWAGVLVFGCARTLPDAFQTNRTPADVTLTLSLFERGEGASSRPQRSAQTW